MTIIPVNDTYINSLYPTQSFEEESVLKARWSSTQNQYVYLNFYVPEYTDSAMIYLYMIDKVSGVNAEISRTSPDWNANEITWDYGRPIKENINAKITEIPSGSAGSWHAFDVSSVINEPGYYSFLVKPSWGGAYTYSSSRASSNTPYMQINTRNRDIDIVHNTKTGNDDYSFLVESGDTIQFSILPPNKEEIANYVWHVNKEKQSSTTESFSFTVPESDFSQPSNCLWEIRTVATYNNGTKLIREWLISTLPNEYAPDYIDYFIDRNSSWRTGYVSDPWGREFPSYSRSENLIENGYYTGSSTSSGMLLVSKFDINYGTFKFKVRNPGILQIAYFRVWGEKEPRYNGGAPLAPRWTLEWTANEFHDYFSIVSHRIGFEGRDWGDTAYIPISRRWLGQAPGSHWWIGDEWREITIIRTEDDWWSAWDNGVMLPYAYANFEDAFNNATRLELAANGILEMDCIQVYENKYLYPETIIEYGTYAKWWYIGSLSSGRYDPVDDTGIRVSGNNVTLDQISQTINNNAIISYDKETKTAILKTNLTLSDGSGLVINNEKLIMDTSSGSLSINPKVGATLKIINSTITATDNPMIWNFASSVSQNIFDPDNIRNVVEQTGTERNNGVYDYRGRFIVEDSIIDNTCNLFLDAPYEVIIKNTVFHNHSSVDYGDYTLRGAYVNHNNKKIQSKGEKGIWIAPRMDLTRFTIENISFVNPTTKVDLKVIGGHWIQNATTFKDSDLTEVSISAKKAYKFEYFVDYRDDTEPSTLALLNCKYLEGNLNVATDNASVQTKYYSDLLIEGATEGPINNAEILIHSSNALLPAESLLQYRDYIIDAYGPGQGGVTNYGVNHASYEQYSGGVHTRWYNALPLGTAFTDSNGRTALPNSGNPKNSVVLIDYVLTSDAGNLKKESLTYTLTANAPSGQSVSLTGISPDPTWYRENPNIPTYTITAIIPNNSTSGPSIIGFAPSEDNPFVPGSTKKFRVWTDEVLTNMNWYVDGVQVSSGLLEYDWSILEGSHTINFEGANGNGAVMQSWSISEKSQVPEGPKAPESSGSGTSYIPSATSFTASIGESTNFIVNTDEQFTSTQWYFNGAAVASDTTSYTQNWDASGSFTVSFEGTTDLGTTTRTWNVVVTGSEYSAISVVPSAGVVAPGETFSLDVYIDPKQPVTGAQLNMHYSTLASVTSVRDGGLFKMGGLSNTFQSGTIDNSAGVLRNVYSAIVGSGTVSTPGSMATVDMVAGASSGMLELTLSNVVLSDAYSNPAPYDITYASILVDTAPVFNAIPAMSVEEESALTFAVSATDADGDTLTYSGTSLPQGATFNAASGTFSWTPARGQAGTYTMGFEATDGYLNDIATAAITVTSLNSAPVITLFEPASGSEFEEGQVIDISVVAEDPEGEPLSYSLTINGVQVSSSAGYQWVTDYSCAGTHSIGVTVSDGNSQVSQTHTIMILDVHPRWDVNQDGVVNILDITLVGQNYGNTYSEDLPRWDVNQDGIVNVQDLSIVAAHFGETVQ
ncbi:hypothetical protein Mpsy_0731 [Methanolobus psychrophilus R15]|nr:hypothetical protein Mpsy_0731 [Methanolobus psychrophilus R15]